MFWPFRMQMSNALVAVGIHSRCHHKLCLFKIPSSSFTISGKTIKSCWHGTDLRNKNGFLHLYRGLHVKLNACVYFVTLPRQLTEPYAFLSGKPKVSMNSSTSIRNNDRRTVQPFVRWGNTQRSCDHSWLAFCEKTLQKCWPITKARHLQEREFKTKTSDHVSSRLAMGL